MRFGVGVRIYGPNYISIGNNCWIDDYAILIGGPNIKKGVKYHKKPNKDYAYKEGEIVIGDNVHIAPFVILQGHGGISIGSNLTIASGSKIYSLIQHYKDNTNELNDKKIFKFVGLVPPDEQVLVNSPIVIHDNSAVGLNSIILPGSVIGKNSWLGANSLLNKVLPDNVIAYGSPVRYIKNRFKE